MTLEGEAYPPPGIGGISAKRVARLAEANCGPPGAVITTHRVTNDSGVTTYGGIINDVL